MAADGMIRDSGFLFFMVLGTLNVIKTRVHCFLVYLLCTHLGTWL